MGACWTAEGLGALVPESFVAAFADTGAHRGCNEHVCISCTSTTNLIQARHSCSWQSTIAQRIVVAVILSLTKLRGLCMPAAKEPSSINSCGGPVQLVSVRVPETQQPGFMPGPCQLMQGVCIEHMHAHSMTQRHAVHLTDLPRSCVRWAAWGGGCTDPYRAGRQSYQCVTLP